MVICDMNICDREDITLYRMYYKLSINEILDITSFDFVFSFCVLLLAMWFEFTLFPRPV